MIKAATVNRYYPTSEGLPVSEDPQVIGQPEGTKLKKNNELIASFIYRQTKPITTQNLLSLEETDPVQLNEASKALKCSAVQI